MSPPITGATVVAGVVGAPVSHSLSPVIFNAWLEVARVDAVYVAFPISALGLSALVHGLRGGVVRGLNVTAPFKEQALALADEASEAARRAGAANLLIFASDGATAADNTDGVGLLSALQEQAPSLDLRAAPAVILGAGGAARGAAAALIAAGVPQVRLVNRTQSRADSLADAMGPKTAVFPWTATAAALSGAGVIINSTPLSARIDSDVSLADLPASVVVMDMVYRPVRTPFLRRAEAHGLRAVDGLAMLIGQARPAFAAMFGAPPPPIDVRALALSAMEAAG
jgi:shikimate dehydrogenase